MARLIIKSAAGPQARVLELRPGVNRLGRNSENDHSLSDPAISEVHCEILVDNDFVFVRDVGSTNGTFVDGQRVVESALYSGQTLRLGPVEFALDAPQVRIALPELPKPEPLKPPPPPELADGYACCPNHTTRHAVWECSFCHSVYCDECIRKLRRVGGAQLKLCPACSNPCQFTPWAEKMRTKKKGLIGRVIGKIKDGLGKQTTRPLP